MAEVLTFMHNSQARVIQIEEAMRFVQPHSVLRTSLERILCVGNGRKLLSSRCAVLATEGYCAEWVTPVEAKQLLDKSNFELIILCSTLSNQEAKEVCACVPHGAKILALQDLILPSELLFAVRRLVR